MESQTTDKVTRNASTTSVSSASNQLYITETLELPEDTFRMSLDNFSVIGENVTIADRHTSVDTLSSSNVDTPVLVIPTPTLTPDNQIPPEQSSLLIDTPTGLVEKSTESTKPKQIPTPFQLPISKKNDFDSFVKPSPVAEIMSPAKMLRFEVNYAASSTPTMKRAAVDFDFFKKNKYNELFDDKPEEPYAEIEGTADGVIESKNSEVTEKKNTIRHEIGYGVKLTDRIRNTILVLKTELQMEFKTHQANMGLHEARVAKQ